MKNKPILRWTLFSPIFLIMYILGLFITPIIYPIRGIIRNNTNLWIFKFFWLFLNDTTEGIDGGDYGRFTHNFIGYYSQCAIRNSHWNLKLLVQPKQGDIENIVGEMRLYNFDRPLRLGRQYATYSVNNKGYFRYSFTKLFKFIRIHTRWYIIPTKIRIEDYVWNVQIGTNKIRYIYKSKIQLK